MTVGLTPEDQKLLRQPFTPEAVKFRIQGKINSRDKTVRVLTYIDARLVAERLSEVDPNWSASYNFIGKKENDPLGVTEHLPVACMLNIKGVQRADVGQNGDKELDDKHVKSAISDSFKRAAVPFGVGAYLYTLGDMKVRPGEYWEQNGKPKGITEKGMKRLREDYRKLISAPAFVERFGEAIDYGDAIVNSSPTEVEVPASSPIAEVEDSSTSPINQQDTASATNSSESEILTLDSYSTVVADLAKATNRSPDAAIKWMQAKKNKSLALKRAVRQAGERGATKEAVEKILNENDMSDYLKSFVETANT